MHIKSAKFVKGVVEVNEIFEDGKPQIAFIGRSNVGKSSTINALTRQKGLAITSSYPGRTRQINVFIINNSFYLIDLPGYGFARGSWEARKNLEKLIFGYLLNPEYKQKKVVLIIDAYVGLTNHDLEMLTILEEEKKNIIVIANKVDKIKKAGYAKQLKKIQDQIGKHKLIPFSAEKRIGINTLAEEISKE